MEAASTTTAQLAFVRPGEDERRTRRRIVNVAALLEELSEPFRSVQIKDLSERGFRASVDAPVDEGSTVMVRLPGMQTVRARVVWSSGPEIGCSFEAELTSAAIDQVLGRNTVARRMGLRREVFGLKRND